MENDNVSFTRREFFVISTDSFDLALNIKQARTLYNLLGKKLSDSKLKTLKKEDLMFGDKSGIFIPAKFRQFAKRTSSLKIGKSTHHYYYFKDNYGNFGFLINNGNVNSFSKLGNILDKSYGIGKVLYGVLKLETFTKNHLVKSRLATNNQRIKAIIDILLIEKYIEHIQNSSGYHVTTKSNELEY